MLKYLRNNWHFEHFFPFGTIFLTNYEKLNTEAHDDQFAQGKRNVSYKGISNIHFLTSVIRVRMYI